MEEQLNARTEMLLALKRELVGPDPRGDYLDCSQPIVFADPSSEAKAPKAPTPAAYRPYRQTDSGDEILSHRDKPGARYGVGVLYPQVVQAEESATVEAGAIEGDSGRPRDQDDINERVQSIEGRLGGARRLNETDDLDVSLANAFQPSSLGLSFLADIPEGSSLVIRATGGRYLPLSVRIGDTEATWSRRQACSFHARFCHSNLPGGPGKARWESTSFEQVGADGLDIRIEAFVRANPVGDAGTLVTVVLVNRESGSAHASDLKNLYQSELEIECAGGSSILPYPSIATKGSDSEEDSIQLLYRGCDTYAVGHGCAANWDVAEDGTTILRAEVLPSFETASITTTIDEPPGDIPIAWLTDMSDGRGRQALGQLAESYEKWIESKQRESEVLEDRYQGAAGVNLQSCREAAGRIRAGLRRLDEDAEVRRAFELANSAIALQQAAGVLPARQASVDTGGRLRFSEAYSQPNPSQLEQHGRGRWRPFQAAFMLLSLCSTADGDDPFRSCVDLIWFPTGGGKTEAYLGLAAFYMFLRRLRDKEDSGTAAIMRYTLRLLTTDQFQRASRLLVAMEYIRRRTPDLGGAAFSIGLWVGGDTSPNRRRDAKELLAKLRSARSSGSAQNKFILDSCPWCGAEMGPIKGRRVPARLSPLGYVADAELDTVAFRCPDRTCEFSTGLPVRVIDDDLYACPPTLLIGTVDKFAQLAWRSDTRSLFGLAKDGSRMSRPPGLIIQDELHLISGPLGTMVGLYETAIGRLCSDGAPPKIVCSTATIRRYKQQVRALYASEQAAVFPPPGLEYDDSFFARHAKDPDGRQLPGRLYVGVHAPGLKSLQTTQVRTLSALLQGPMRLPGETNPDPWWTPLVFFNSLRELGTTLSLIQSDIPDYLDTMRRREDLPWEDLRSLTNPQELTGRISGEDVPAALRALRRPADSPDAIDICLASNMVEVGVDIPRLSLMVVVGQPKSTAAYIQATGRIGRDWKKKPGLVVTIYGASKPRDRSHFEKFRTYHERLYSQVEPLSVTPMSAPALERALHGVIVAYARQVAPQAVSQSPHPYASWERILTDFRELIGDRAQIVSEDDVENLERLLSLRMSQWRRWDHLEWGGPFNQSEEVPLMVSAGAHVPPTWRSVVWPTPTSLRNVDQECQMEVPTLDRSRIEEGSADE